MSESLPESAEASAVDLSVPQEGPKRTTSLKVRRSPVASARYQIETLNALDLERQAFRGDFQAAMNQVTEDGLRAADVEILQLNLGKLCNMTCRHCHVDAGPDRWREVMDRETAESCVAALDRLPTVTTVDLTGGAPELNPHFRYLVDACVERGRHVIDRCNLTVLLVQSCRDLPEWLAERGVEVVCSLPHYRRRNTDAQRGDGTFEKSLEALRRLNEAGYGQGDPKRRLTVMVNPVGALLTGCQSSIEREWKAGLERNHGLSFDRLISLNNMPISRFLEWLLQSGNLEKYMELLVRSFNPATVDGLMCRNTLSVSWDGRIYDCDFNQMLELDSRVEGGASVALDDLTPELLTNREIVVGRHCFGCTAGAGSSCGGALDE
jgi:radical SAM/Cys-rich protein